MFVSRYVFVYLPGPEYYFDNLVIETCSLRNAAIIENVYYGFQIYFDLFLCIITVMVASMVLVGIFH